MCGPLGCGPSAVFASRRVRLDAASPCHLPHRIGEQAIDLAVASLEHVEVPSDGGLVAAGGGSGERAGDAVSSDVARVALEERGERDLGLAGGPAGALELRRGARA